MGSRTPACPGDFNGRLCQKKMTESDNGEGVKWRNNGRLCQKKMTESDNGEGVRWRNNGRLCQKKMSCHDGGHGTKWAGGRGDVKGRLCQKKMSDSDKGEGVKWYCERCSDYKTPIWRYLVNLSALDHTGVQWVTSFGETAEAIFGCNAEAIKDLEINNPDEYNRKLMDANMQQLLFKLKVAEDNYNDEARIKASIFKVEPINPVKEGMLIKPFIFKVEPINPVKD
eukprot:gene25473-11133_t